MKKNSLSAWLKDCVKALCIGLCAAAAVFVLLVVLGSCLGGFALSAGLETARRGLLIIGAILLFVSAAALIAQDKAASLAQDPRWKKHFSALGLFSVLFWCAVGILLVASALDSILFYW